MVDVFLCGSRVEKVVENKGRRQITDNRSRKDKDLSCYGIALTQSVWLVLAAATAKASAYAWFIRIIRYRAAVSFDRSFESAWRASASAISPRPSPVPCRGSFAAEVQDADPMPGSGKSSW